MNRSQLVRAVARKHQLSETETEKIVATVLNLISDRLASGEHVTLINFGRFVSRLRKPSLKRNPRNGEEMKVPARVGVVFLPAPALKEKLNDAPGSETR